MGKTNFGFIVLALLVVVTLVGCMGRVAWADQPDISPVPSPVVVSTTPTPVPTVGIKVDPTITPITVELSQGSLSEGFPEVKSVIDGSDFRPPRFADPFALGPDFERIARRALENGPDPVKYFDRVDPGQTICMQPPHHGKGKICFVNSGEFAFEPSRPITVAMLYAYLRPEMRAEQIVVEFRSDENGPLEHFGSQKRYYASQGVYNPPSGRIVSVQISADLKAILENPPEEDLRALIWLLIASDMALENAERTHLGWTGGYEVIWREVLRRAEEHDFILGLFTPEIVRLRAPSVFE